MRKYLKWFVAAFIIFYLLNNPKGAADTVDGIASGLESAANSLSIFVNNVGKQ